MDNITLIVGPERQIVDTKDIKAISINFNLSDIADFGSRETSFTKPIEIIQTPATDKVFKSIFEINSIDGFDFQKKTYADIQNDGLSQLTGSLQLISVNENTYSVIVSANNINLIKDLGDELIKGNPNSENDLNFDNAILSHTPSLSSVREIMDSTPVFDGAPLVLYPIIDYTGRLPALIDGETYITLPAITARTIFDKIILDAGYTCEFSSGIEAVFNQLMIPYNDDYRKLGTTFDAQRIYLGANSDTVELTGADMGIDDGVLLGVIDVGVPFGAVAGSRYVEGDNYLFDFPAGYSSPRTGIRIKNSGYLTPHLFLSISNLAMLDDAIVKVSVTTSNGSIVTTYDLGELTLDGNSYQIIETGEGDNYLDELSIYCEAGGRLYINVTSDNPLVKLNRMSSYVDLTLSDYLYSGEKTLNINDLLPVNYKKADFIKDVFAIFNAKVTIDKIDETHLFIDTYDSFNAKGTRLDWTDKIENNGLKFEPLSASLSAKHIFSMSDDEDIYIKNYNEIQLKNYQQKELKNENEFTKGETTIKLTIAPTAFNVCDEGIVTPLIANSDGIFKSEWKPRMLFYNKIVGTDLMKWGSDLSENGIFSNNFPTLSDTLYPLIADNENSDNVVLSFNNSDQFLNEVGRSLYNNNTIYNLYYKDEIEHAIFSGAKKLTAKVHLTASDIYDLNFADEIEIFHNEIGPAVYRINKIKNFSGAQSLTDVEFIQLRYLDVSFDAKITPDVVYYTPISTDGGTDKTSTASAQSVGGEAPHLDSVLAVGNESSRGLDVDYVKINGVLQEYKTGMRTLAEGTQFISFVTPFVDKDDVPIDTYIPKCFGKTGNSISDIRINWIPPAQTTGFYVRVSKSCNVYYNCTLINDNNE